MADGRPLPFQEAEHQRLAHLWVDQREQLLQVARLPGELDASHQLDALGSHPPQCPPVATGTGGAASLRRQHAPTRPASAGRRPPLTRGSAQPEAWSAALSAAAPCRRSEPHTTKYLLRPGGSVLAPGAKR
jgi:hypothetical protein